MIVEKIENKNELKESVFNLVKDIVDERKSIYEDLYIWFSQKNHNYNNYSFSNLAYLRNQGANITASFKAWSNLGFKIIKGEKSKKVFAPRFKTFYFNIDDERTPKEIKEKMKKLGVRSLKEKKINGFTLVSVFDFKQLIAESEEAKELEEKILENIKTKKVLTDSKSLLEKLEKNYPIKYKDMVVMKGGYACKDYIAIRKNNNTSTNQFFTAIHEIIHYELHFDSNSNLSRDIEELEAELGSLITKIVLGFDSENFKFSRRYIQTWLRLEKNMNVQEEEYLKEIVFNSFERVFKLVEKVIKILHS